MIKEVRICKYDRCNSEFIPTRKDKIYCSVKCCKRDSALKWTKENKNRSTENKQIYAILHKEKVEKARKTWREAHPKEHIQSQRKYSLKKFNLTTDGYSKLLESQNGVCKICKSPPTGKYYNLCVDHNHACCNGDYSCGKCIRGLLCQTCNKNIGFLENKEWIKLAEAYLGGIK